MKAHAQTASVSTYNWSEDSDNDTRLLLHAVVSYDDTGTLTGSLGVSSGQVTKPFTARGICANLTTSQDAQGNLSAVMEGPGFYYTILNGVLDRETRQRCSITMTLYQNADKTYSESVSITDLSGNVLYSTPTADNGSLLPWALTRGAIAITL